ncbi:Armadillo repeat-containing protein 6 [Blattella germanica]|nr:Armadillo repeat-containing protein 6 [Blattella germanica]
MVRVITQETFNEVVKENIEDLDMSPEEAVQDAVEQFEAQGVDLSIYFWTLHEYLLSTLDKLGNEIKTHGKENEILVELKNLKEECDKRSHKVFAGSNCAYNILNYFMEMWTLNAAVSLMNGNPDLLDKKGIYLDTQKNPKIVMKVLEWTKVCCIKHEQNRQDIFGMKLLDRLKTLLHTKDVLPGVVKNVCCVARALTLDDDIRVQFGKAHEHARELAAESVPSQIYSEKINRQCLKLVKGLAGNDDVKVHIVQKGIGPLIVSSMHRHEQSAGVVGAGCGTIAALCLRCSANSKILFESGAPEVIVQGMKIHDKDSDVQKQGSWAIRNMVSRDKSLCNGFLKRGAEDILRAAIKRHGKRVDYDAKAALRDLGCKIE